MKSEKMQQKEVMGKDKPETEQCAREERQRGNAMQC
jgi:hypothetical protein